MRSLLPLCLAVLACGPLAAAPVDYRRDVRPILDRHCVSCHGAAKHRSGLRLDTAAGALRGGSAGPAVVAGNSGKSNLVLAVIGAADVVAMPPKGPRLGDKEVAVLRAWIDAGAQAPADEVEVGARGSLHWSFLPIKRPAEPSVREPSWGRNAIDRFVLARLEKEGIAPSSEADRTTLLRRAFLDLTGLPPSPADVDAFLADTSADAYEKVIDRLLASAHYGEKWGRHWLDLARYADSNGYSIDSPRSIWKYRDWVIAALNRNLPFDQFVIEQLAGDLLPHPTLEQRVATGFHRNTQINEEGGIDLEQFRVESIVDRVNTTGSALLGLTIGCCQCHDHKFDPFSQREYYQLFAFFNNCDEPTIELSGPDVLRRREQVRQKLKALETRLRPLEDATPERVLAWEGSLTPASRAMLPANIQHILTIATNGRNPEQERAVVTAYRKSQQVRHALGGLASPTPFLTAIHAVALAQRQDLEKQIAALQKEEPRVPTTMVLAERKTPRMTHVHLAGDFLRKGAVVRPDVPCVLPPLRSPRPNRLDLARWLVGNNNPLTPRVAVNRYWQQFFGIGLVETENDFGAQGTPPSHPDLLDWLASEFVRSGWDIKAMHRLMVTSATYRQSSRARPDLQVRDPRNQLLARQNRLRLDAEVVRDVALASSGLLARTIGGPSVYPPQPAGVYQFTQVPRTWQSSTGPDRYRRGMYTFVWRSAPHPDLVVFDAPDGTQACTRRNRSNTPLQALALLNDQGFYEYAQALAARTQAEAPDDNARLSHAFRLCLGRPPSQRELAVLARLLQQQRENGTQDGAWVAVSRALLNLDETITRE